MVPTVTRMAVLTNPANPSHGLLTRAAETAGQTLKIHVRAFSAQTAGDLNAAFAAMRRERIGAVLVLSDAGLFALRSRVNQLAAANRLPTMYSRRKSGTAASPRMRRACPTYGGALRISSTRSCEEPKPAIFRSSSRPDSNCSSTQGSRRLCASRSHRRCSAVRTR